MVEKENNFNYSIKGKLISAVAMLMVAVIMVVSSTYAWFTLSTAPEVTGISTAVGANGALEMLLLTKDETGAWVYNEGILDNSKDENTYWGNLVDLAKPEYGSNKITLYPSMLNIDGMFEDGVKVRENIVAGDVINATNPILVPKYNANGRPTDLLATGSFGLFGGTSFVPNDNAYGFRALGVASGLSERQQAFRAALGALGTAQSSGLNLARNALSENGNALAAIAVRRGMNGDSATYSEAEIQAVKNMITGLENSLKKLEEAYIQFLVTAALSTQNASDDIAAIAAAKLIENTLSGTGDVGTRLTAALNAAGVTDAATTLAGYSTFTSAVADLLSAKAVTITATGTDGKYIWGDFSNALTPLVDTGKVTVDGLLVSEVKTDEGKNTIMNNVLANGGVTVAMPTGAGVFADVADLCGDYQVDVTIQSADLDVGINGLSVKAKMKADSQRGPDDSSDWKYLETLKTGVKALEPQGANGVTLPLTEFYGYVVDLAFKTNAAQSNLLLQYDGTDRIYSDNNNEATMGGGSTMTFESSALDFSTEQVKALMKHIRVIFFTPGTSNTVLAEARLDVDNAVLEGNGVTAQIKIWETVSNVYSYKATSTSTAITVYAKTVEYGADTPDDTADDKTVTEYYSDKAFSADKLVVTSENISADATLTQIKQKFADQDDAVIRSLDQNQTHHVSALVYLDGESITNKDVAATAATSMTGTVNLQFASSAVLVPMEYGDLYTPNTSEAAGA